MAKFDVIINGLIDADSIEDAESKVARLVHDGDWTPMDFEVLDPDTPEISTEVKLIESTTEIDSSKIATVEEQITKKVYTQEEVVELLNQERIECSVLCRNPLDKPFTNYNDEFFLWSVVRREVGERADLILARLDKSIYTKELPKIKIVIEVDGGVVQNINANVENTKVCIIDYDTDGCDLNDYIQLVGKDTDEDLFVGTIHIPFYNPELVDEFFKRVDVEETNLDLSKYNIIEMSEVGQGNLTYHRFTKDPIISSVKEYNKQLSSLLRLVTLTDIKEDPTLKFSTPELKDICLSVNGYVPRVCINSIDKEYVVYEYYHSLDNTILDLGILQTHIVEGYACGKLVMYPNLIMDKANRMRNIMELNPEDVAITVLSVKEIYNGLFVTFKIPLEFFRKCIKSQLGDIETPQAHGFPMYLSPMILNFHNDYKLVRFDLTIGK